MTKYIRKVGHHWFRSCSVTYLSQAITWLALWCLQLIHYGLVTLYGIIGFGEHCLRWGLVARQRQTITWTNADLLSKVFCGKHLRAVSQVALMNLTHNSPDSKVHGANMGPTWVLSAPDGPHVFPMNLAIREYSSIALLKLQPYFPGTNELSQSCDTLY